MQNLAKVKLKLNWRKCLICSQDFAVGVIHFLVRLVESEDEDRAKQKLKPIDAASMTKWRSCVVKSKR